MRGKHANAAEARAVREGALAESAQLRRDNDRLAAELAQARQDLNDNLATSATEQARLRRLVVSGSSEELDAARARIEEMRQEALQDRKFTDAIGDALGRGYYALQDAYEALGMKEADAHEAKLKVFKVIPSKSSPNGFIKVDDLTATIGTGAAIGSAKGRARVPESDADRARVMRLQRAKGLRA